MLESDFDESAHADFDGAEGAPTSADDDEFDVRGGRGGGVGGGVDWSRGRGRGLSSSNVDVPFLGGDLNRPVSALENKYAVKLAVWLSRCVSCSGKGGALVRFSSCFLIKRCSAG
jgi:hypothetical protein